MTSTVVIAQLLVLSCRLSHAFYSGAAPVAFYCKTPSTRRLGTNQQEDQTIPTQFRYDLTILIPAYNEIDRIGGTLSKYMSYLSQTNRHQHTNLVDDDQLDDITKLGTVSILVVDDGSTDGTADYVRGQSYLETLSEKYIGCWDVTSGVKCICLTANEGKGAAICKGMQEIASSYDDATRQLVLVADADGSGDISCLGNMMHELEMLLQSKESKSDALVVGYRQCKDKSQLRSILSWGFRTAVSLIFLGSHLGVRDTQCGFKLMTVSTGKRLYNNLNLRRWTHDVEVIYRAQMTGVPVGECPVTWIDAEGSKLVTSTSKAVTVSFVMLVEIATMRLKYMIGEWNVSQNTEGTS